MRLELITLSHEQFEYKEDLPPHFTGPLLPGSQRLFVSGDFGEICVQEFDGGDYLLRSWFVRALENFEASFKSLFSGVYVEIMQRNTISAVIKKSEVIHLTDGQFTMLHASEPEVEVNYKAKQRYLGFEALLTPAMAQEIQSAFSTSASTVRDYSPAIPIVWINPPQWAHHEVHEQIRNIFNYSEDPGWQRDYFHKRVRDIYWKLLAQHERSIKGSPILTAEEQEKAGYVHRLIIDNLDKWLLIPDLSRQAGISESRLKKIFQKAYGMGIHEFRIYQRLQVAIRLLNEGKLVKEAAAATGWRAADLTKAYQKIYHTIPSAHRKKK